MLTFFFKTTNIKLLLARKELPNFCRDEGWSLGFSNSNPIGGTLHGDWSDHLVEIYLYFICFSLHLPWSHFMWGGHTMFFFPFSPTSRLNGVPFTRVIHLIPPSFLMSTSTFISNILLVTWHSYNTPNAHTTLIYYLLN